MIWSLLGALAASACFGVATVLQAIAARKALAGQGVDPRLLIRLAGQLPYVVGTLLDLVGFVAELAALRSLPLFVVQAIIAANLAVTAVVAARVMKIRLCVREWTAVVVVCAGLLLLGLSAGHESATEVSARFRWALLAGVVVLFAGGTAAGRLRGKLRAMVLGLAAGLGFGVVAIAARALTSLSPLDLLRDPAVYAIGLGGVTALLFYATALQRGSVTTTTAAVVVAETVVPAAVGIWLLGDQTRHGYVPVAFVGFVLAVTGALALARFGEPALTQQPTHVAELG
jgi:drug/metabolite transporter (DMT)-like permease